jgi:molybdenum cofactor guanylyltransferase
MTMLKATGAILAGGSSSRLGTDKAVLKMNNHTLLEHAADKLQALLPEVIVIGSDYKKYQIPHIAEYTDLYQNCGPLGGIHAALQYASFDLVLVAACDIPFWNSRLAKLLIRSCAGFDAAVPRLDGYYEPLLAVYSKACLPAVKASLDSRQYKVSGFYAKINVRFIERAELERVCNPEEAFRNINIPDDLRFLPDK